jgi:hypothetical protein
MASQLPLKPGEEGKREHDSGKAKAQQKLGFSLYSWCPGTADRNRTGELRMTKIAVWMPGQAGIQVQVSGACLNAQALQEPSHIVLQPSSLHRLRVGCHRGDPANFSALTARAATPPRLRTVQINAALRKNNSCISRMLSRRCSSLRT